METSYMATISGSPNALEAVTVVGHGRLGPVGRTCSSLTAVDIDDTPEEAAFRAEARAWLDAHAIPRGHPDDFSLGMWTGAYDEDTYIARCQEWQRTLYDGGWAGITWPKEHGGRGGRPIEQVIFGQEQANYGVSSGALMISIGMAGPTILAHGDDDQKARFLGPLLRGDELWCQLFSEPGAGSDLAGLTTRAVARRRRVGRHRPEGVDLRRPTGPGGGCCSPGPTRPPPSTGGSATSCSRWTRPASTSGRCAR